MEDYLSDPVYRVLIMGVIIAGAISVSLFLIYLIQLITIFLSKVLRIKPCDHKFRFHDPELMEHEPFCSRCHKGLTEIND